MNKKKSIKQREDSKIKNDKIEKDIDEYFNCLNKKKDINLKVSDSKNMLLDKGTDFSKNIEESNKSNKKEIEDKKDEQNESLKKLKYIYYIDLEKFLREQKKELKLRGPKKEENYVKYLRDEGFKLISFLGLQNLIEINFANNFITKLDPLNNMLLPHLEIINFSDNLIEDITPLANLFSEKLSEIYLQNNKIQDLEPFKDSEFPSLEILRVDGEGNKNAIERDNFNIIKNKYKNKIYYETINLDTFNKEYKYNYNYNENNNKLDLGSRGKKILTDLFLLIKYPNNIKSIILSDNKLQDASLLKRMPLYNLELLDLSVNFIMNIEFLKKMSKKCKKLRTLFLNDNKIKCISPLVKEGGNNNRVPIFNLKYLTLKNNNLDKNDKTTKEIISIFVNNAQIFTDCDDDII